MPHDANQIGDLLHAEIDQRRETGYDVSDVEGDLAAAGPEADDGVFEELLARVEALPEPTGWAYEEPSTLAEITAALPAPGSAGSAPRGEELADKVLGAWLGRVAGNMLGKPIENGDHWTRAHIKAFLDLSDAYPLTDYIPVPDPCPAEYELRDNWVETTRGRVDGSSRDDDVDYTVLGLHLVETHGRDLRAEHVAQQWLLRFPYHQVYTAERAAYRNLVAGVRPPESATVRNPYREWIGALIRADIYGYVLPGRPREAALMAYADASVSHVANGIYGEMWAAALVSAAFTADSPREAIEAALAQVPPRSRLAEILREIVDLHAGGASWGQAMELVAARTGHYAWVHTPNNAAVIAAGLLWGGGDYTRSIALTVQGGLDTDSNGATAGSVAGIMTGAAALPGHWVEPLRDRLRSALFGFDGVAISELARRTIQLAENSTS